MEFALLALACPIGMGLMMWFMAKGMSMGRRDGNADSQAKEQPSLEELRAEQERLAARISELDRGEASSSSAR
jgi:cell division protein FtsB